VASNLKILAYETTELGVLCLRRRELLSRPGTIVTDVTLNHELLMSSHVTLSERTLARRALELHPGHDLRVLVAGLGLGYTAHEALVAGADRIQCVEVIEYLAPVIDWLERDLVPLSRALKADARLRVVRGDAYARLATPASDSHDLILIDVDHSPAEHLGSANAGFYTEPGLRLAQQHLAEHGILAVWSYAEHSAFESALRRVFADVRVEPVTVLNDLIDEEQTDWLFFARGSHAA
jgi:spermidine synthase